MQNPSTRIILASASKARKNMLIDAGLVFRAVPADVDEDKITAQLLQKKASPKKIAAALAEAKALAVAAENPGSLVIGADQVLECGGLLFSKAKDGEEARRTLKALRGKMHNLVSAVCVAQLDKILWRHDDSASLTMHGFDDKFLQHFCSKTADALTQSVGAYQLEKGGAWLFDTIEGDYFTVLGMPLLPLLGYLREEHGAGP